jgi:formate dehydrogenase maturation protein FdhE
MGRLSGKTENWFDTVILTVKNLPRNLLLSTRKRRTHAERSDTLCPKCESNKVVGVVIDDDPIQPIIHFVCEACGTEWVE